MGAVGIDIGRMDIRSMWRNDASTEAGGQTNDSECVDEFHVRSYLI
jgi:hypothetical protein